MTSYNEQIQIEGYKQQCAMQLEDRKHQLESLRIQSGATIQFGLQAVKSLLLANGGAVIGLLTFMGHDKSNGAIYQKDLMARALYAFGSGTGFALSVAVVAYVSQSLIAELPSRPDGRDSFEGTMTRYFATGLGVMSLILFIWGTISAGNAFYIGAK